VLSVLSSFTEYVTEVLTISNQSVSTGSDARLACILIVPSKFSVAEFMKKYHNSKDYDVRYNKIQHQFKNSECGVYSMNFIIRLLGGETFDEIVNNKI
jgi:DNA polymerase/3'-5' exonuclease PolX